MNARTQPSLRDQLRAAPRERVTTPTGIEIGRSYVPRRPLWTFTQSEEDVQRALLARPPSAVQQRVRGIVLAVVIALGLVAVLLHSMGALFQTGR